ncbi:MAG: hypothetical protein RLZZ59_729 [Pseudomonadota bacterium]|jgi:hypothetical protein
MLGRIFSSFGGFFGNFFGGGIISTVMRFAGRALGNYLERTNYDPTEYYHYKHHIDNLYISTSTNGQPIPLVLGRARVAGHIIWAMPIEEIPISSTDYKYFKDSDNLKSIYHSTEYLYYASFAMAICEGVVSEIGRIWINGVESDISEYKHRIYYGTEHQIPDPFMEGVMGRFKTPAHRGICYIVFERLPLSNFGNKIPSFNFEVTRTSSVSYEQSLEAQITNMVMIPGSGEFIYDTICQDKIVCNDEGIELYRESINHHTTAGITNALVSLNNLQNTCKNLKWIAPVVTWFTDSMDAGSANIFPAVEHNGPSFKTTEEWLVAGKNRDNTRVISRDANGSPSYGGTINDASLVRYLEEMKSRGIKIMLYPMIFVDLPGKPWRGYITGSPEGVIKFFNHSEGYKNFILHYARLAKGRVDAFVIGSELASITKVRDGNNFPAVKELIALAQEVKAILGPSVTVTYAADWSEYHHTDGGWYHLDDLWSSEAIDVIGIDAYFPITNTNSSDIDIDTIKEGWQSGEAWDYYIDDNGAKVPLDTKWGFKNIEYWWNNKHQNPDGSYTSWIPKSKKVWFTEFGFPSIDKATNQPNVFYDPACVNGGVPRYSNGEADFAIQRKAIKASIDFWSGSDCVEEMFLWTWDARPYPLWPYSDIWNDGTKWLYGHWVNGKLSSSSLGNILLELCNRSGIDINNVKIDTIDEIVSGIAITKQSSIWDVISLLRLVYFFDIRSNYSNIIEFKKRGFHHECMISNKDIVRDKNNLIEVIDVSESNMVSEIIIHFPDDTNSYLYNNVHITGVDYHNKAIYCLTLPLVIDEVSARNIGEKILASSRLENKTFKLTLMMDSMFYLSPGDVFIIIIYDVKYRLRVTDFKYHDLICDMLCVFDYDAFDYKIPDVAKYNQVRILSDPRVEFFELPISITRRNMGILYASSGKKSSLYSLMNDKVKIADLKESCIGTVIDVENAQSPSDKVVDGFSRFILHSDIPIDSPTLIDIELGQNAILIGDEVIYFRKVENVSDKKYLISELIRGACLTQIAQHNPGERFVLLNQVTEIPIVDSISNTKLHFEVCGKTRAVEYKRVTKKSATISDLTVVKNSSGIEIKWRGRVKNIDLWSDVGANISYKIILEDKGLTKIINTSDEHYYINFSREGISGIAKISIVAMQLGFAESDKIFV